jgi:hypothetical protein
MVNPIGVFPSDVKANFINVTMWEHCTFDRFLEAAMFTTLTPLSLLILCKLSFPIVGLKMSSLPTSAVKPPRKFLYGIYGIHRIHVLVPDRSCHSYHKFYRDMNIQNNSCTPTTSCLYFDSSFATVMSEPALFRLLTFHIPNLMSIFLSLGHLSKESVHVQCSL